MESVEKRVAVGRWSRSSVWQGRQGCAQMQNAAAEYCLVPCRESFLPNAGGGSLILGQEQDSQGASFSSGIVGIRYPLCPPLGREITFWRVRAFGSHPFKTIIDGAGLRISKIHLAVTRTAESFRGRMTGFHLWNVTGSKDSFGDWLRRSRCNSMEGKGEEEQSTVFSWADARDVLRGFVRVSLSQCRWVAFFGGMCLASSRNSFVTLSQSCRRSLPFSRVVGVSHGEAKSFVLHSTARGSLSAGKFSVAKRRSELGSFCRVSWRVFQPIFAPSLSVALVPPMTYIPLFLFISPIPFSSSASRVALGAQTWPRPCGATSP